VRCGGIWGRLVRLVIRRHPELYLKFIAVNFCDFYRTAFLNAGNYEKLRHRYDYLYVRRVIATSKVLPKSDLRDMQMEYWEPAPQPHVRREGEQIVVDSTCGRRLHERYNRIHAATFLRSDSALALLAHLARDWNGRRSGAIRIRSGPAAFFKFQVDEVLL
jgi:hypothetical protein